jgi:outer membrane protein TolC
MKIFWRGALTVTWLAWYLMSVSAFAEPVPLKRIVELALAHATAGAIASIDEQRVSALYQEARDSYIPQVTVGAGLGPPSYGFPLSIEGSAPSLFNVNAQSALLNFSLRSFVHSAKAETNVAALNTKDQRELIIQDTALSYTALAKWEQRLGKLQQTETDANNMQAAVAQRVKEGVDSAIDETRARLSAARVRLRIAEARGAADVLREHLSKLTGLSATSIQIDPDSIAPVPASSSNEETPASQSTSFFQPSVEAAVEHARAQYLRAQGEHRALWPTLDFGAQYALFSTFNNFQNYYIPSHPCTVASVNVLCVSNTFQQNNASVGVNIRIPVLNFSQHARAKAADFEALKATKQAEAARNQATEETLRLRRAVTQFQAARDVAQLELEIAEKNLPAVQTRIDAGTANLHDLDDARTQASERFIALQDVSFELERANLGLMRATGDLEKWALGGR